MNELERIEKIIADFSSNNIQIAIAESCTGGYISHMMTNISGASKVFERGVISYSNESKIELLNIDSDILEKHGAVSEPIAEKMADNIRNLSRVDIGIGITGIAGPTGDTAEKPIGLVYIGFSTQKETTVIKKIFKSDRIHFKELVLEEIIQFLEKYEKIN